MIVKNTTRESLQKALAQVNKQYAGNITWKRAPEALNDAGTRYRFTIRAIQSTGKGGRLSATRTTKDGEHARVGQSACWHAHGHFFDALFKVSPDAVIMAGTSKITKDAGNWQDRNIGSMFVPMYYSDACDCEK